MSAVFETVLNMSRNGAVVILAVLAIRLLLRRAPRKYSYALWSVAAFRLVCPVSVQTVFSLFNFTGRVDQVQVSRPVTDAAPTVSVSTGITYPGYVDVGDLVPAPSAPPVSLPDSGASSAVDLTGWAVDAAAVLWLAVLAALLLYGVVSYIRLRRRMSTAVRLEGRVWQSDRVRSPFILGFLRPRIYLPFGLSGDQERYVRAHEEYHLKRLDHIVRPLAFLLLAVHWFNPLVWAAYYLMSRDMEMSCDEKVLAGGENARDYSTTLLSFAANRRFPSPSPLAFGESGVRGRIKNALNWKRPRTWVTVAAIAVCIAAVVVCASDAADSPHDWTGTVAADEIDTALFSIADSDTGEWATRSLTDEETGELVEILNGIPRRKLDNPHTILASGWAFPAVRMVTVSSGGVDYVLTFGPAEQVTITCSDETVDWQGEDTWFVNSDALKEFFRDLPEETPARYYVSKSCICLCDFDDEPITTGYILTNTLYQIGGWSVMHDIAYEPLWYGGRFLNETVHFPETLEWRDLTEEEWSSLFSGVGRLASDYRSGRICSLPERYTLLDLDGELWVVDRPEDVVRSVFSLKEVTLQELRQGRPSQESPNVLGVWQFDLTHDGVDETIRLTAGAWSTADADWTDFTVTVTDAQGNVLWTDVFSEESAGRKGIYLYQRDGLNYLMTDVEYTYEGTDVSYHRRYAVFSLGADGSLQILEEWELYYEKTFSLSEIYRFMETVNGLLVDGKILLSSTRSGDVQYSTTDELLPGILAYDWNKVYEDAN